ncbi:MAG TPA: hypothetical protein VJO14_07750 [Bacteroidota bacterium]|nr:hypothetical protein [Bacteroidota bacterium]
MKTHDTTARHTTRGAGNLSAAALIAALFLTALTAPAAAAGAQGIRIISLRGDVSVRHGASEDWVKAAPGDALRPEDSIRLDNDASATISLNVGPVSEREGAAEGGTEDGRKILLPPMVIVDVADLRNMTRADLLMKLAMEDIRSTPKPPAGGGGDMQKTTTTRAGDRDTGPTRGTNPGSVNGLRLNGAKVLHDNGFYGPCVLRSREILRIEPALAKRLDARLLMADALEKMNLGEEAYNAYRSLAGEKLSGKDKALVERKLEELKK